MGSTGSGLERRGAQQRLSSGVLLWGPLGERRHRLLGAVGLEVVEELEATLHLRRPPVTAADETRRTLPTGASQKLSHTPAVFVNVNVESGTE